MSKEDYELLKQEEKSAYKEEEKSEKQQRKAIVVELKGIEDRIVRLTPSSSELGDAVLSREGEKLYYLASFEGGLGLWEMNLRSKNTRLIHKLNGNWGSLVLVNRVTISFY